MKRVTSMVFLAGVAACCLLLPRPASAQACQDEEAMVVDSQKSLTDVVAAVRKESLSDFERTFHQKSTLTKITFSLGMVNELLGCLEKAAADSTATKEQSEAYKTKRDTYNKLKDKCEADRKALKGTGDPKAAKALIEKFDFSS